MAFVPFSEVAALLRGRRVAVVGSGPGSLDNEPGAVDAYDVVVRVNNFKCGPAQGERVSIHYSFFGTSVRADAADLLRRGCRICVCKLPNSQPIDSEWHRVRGKLVGIDYRYIYTKRAAWWPCDVFVPDDARFLAKFELLGRHQPTTGFAAILDVLECEPREAYLTGFDGFTSGIHNVDEPWRPGDATDPIGHRPDLELQWLRDNRTSQPITFDKRLSALLG